MSHYLDLLGSARGGNDRAKEQLLAEIRPQLCRWAMESMSGQFAARFDASDMAQQTLIDIHGSLLQFTGTTEAELIDWLWRSLERNILDAIRHAKAQKRDVKREERMDVQDSSDPHVFQPVAAESVRTSPKGLDEASKLALSLHVLTPDQRQAVQLVYFDGKPLAEAAATMQKNKGAVAKLLQRGIKTLRAHVNTPSDLQTDSF